MFSNSNLFDGESSLPSICLCRLMSASSAMVGAPASQMSDLPTNVFAIMHPYRLCQSGLALLLTDRHNTAAASWGHFDLGDGGFSLCPACSRPGLRMHPYSRRLYCHRCRAVALERWYDKLLEINGFTIDIKRMILWFSFMHPFEVFKAEARALRTCHMTDLLRGPPWTYGPLWNTREAMEEDITRGVFWKGKRYTVGRLTAYQDFLTLVTDFLY
jgi:endogenous inhibitor of DNA gyrase (YacG/DUF329 family)